MRCRLASSKSKDSTAGTAGVVSVSLGTRDAVSRGMGEGGSSAATLTFFEDGFERDFEGESSSAALRFPGMAESDSFGTGARPDAERVVGMILANIILAVESLRLIYNGRLNYLDRYARSRTAFV